MANEVLITGANGFIGCALTDHLRARAYVVTGLARSRPAELVSDLLEPDLPAATLAGRRFDAVVHLASPSRGNKTADAEAEETAAVINLVQALGQNGRPPFLFFSTADELGDLALTPQSETAPVAPMNDYGRAKRAARLALEEWASENAQPYTVFRLFNVYGEGQDQMLVSYLTAGAKAGGPLTISAHEKIRDYIHVSDVCRAVEAWLQQPRTRHSLYHVGTGRGTCTAELVRLIAHLRAEELKVIGDETIGRDNPRALIADTRRIRTDLGWQATVSLEEGLAALMAADHV